MPAEALTAANAISRFLAPLADLYSLRDQLVAFGSLDQAAAEAQARIDDENRQVETARAQLDALVKAQAVARDATAVTLADTKTQADKIVGDAQVAAQAATDAQTEADTAAHDAAVSALADLTASIADSQAKLDAIAASEADAEARLADAQDKLAAIRATIGA